MRSTAFQLLIKLSWLLLKSGAVALVMLLLLPTAWADNNQASQYPWRQEDQRAGYEDEVLPENEEVGEILYSIPDPRASDPNLNDRIFSQKLTKEFETRYAEQFGRTSPEIIYTRTPYLTSNYTEGQSLTFDEEEYQDRQRRFGNFMLKRLVEFHIQNESKTNPQLKAVNEVKEKVEKVDVSFSKNYKLRAKYHISSNTARFSILNPYIDFTMRMELARTLSFNETLETVFSFQKSFNDLGIATYIDYYQRQKRLDIINSKAINSYMSVSLTVSPFRDTEVSTNEYILERIFIGGVGIVF